MREDITLTDLFEIEVLQRIQDAFSKMTGMASIITDAEGKPVTRGANFTDFCKLYTRNSSIGCLRCEQCDKHGAELALKVGASVTYYCHAGLVDFAAPIMAGDEMIGCFVGGQVLTEPPDITKIMQVAAEIDVELINYLQSVLKVRVMDKNKVEDAAFFLYTLTDILSSIAYHKYEMHQANIEIEKVANMKSDFLANMSHEIRTPMNAVIGMAEMAMREELTPAAQNYISQIQSSGKTLLTIINDILDFSKIESGKMDIIPVDYEPLSVINDVINIINTRMTHEDVTFILSLNPTLPKILNGDNIRIQQIITNICNNAVKFTKKGQVILKIDYDTLDAQNINLKISVIDTGIGIKKQDLSKLFRSFQQVDSKRNRNMEGTGLGLAISKQLLNLMNGDISVESVYGKGSTFSFHLPQKVIQAEPCISLKKEEDYQVIGYIENPFIQKQLEIDSKNLGIEYIGLSLYSQLQELDFNKKTYLFLEHHLFRNEVQQLVRENSQISAVIITDYDSTAEYSLPNSMTVKKPLCVLNLASILNGETPLQLQQQSSDALYDFTAPDAKILLVDDNTINLTVAKGLLKPFKMHIDTATSGQDAIDKISVEKYDIVFMDHMMPEIDGVETTHLIRRFHKEYDQIPIIALTANAVSGVREMFISEGMNDFIAKPIEIKTLVAKLRQWLPKQKIVEGSSNLHSDHATLSAKPELSIKGLDTTTALSFLGSEELFWSVLEEYYNAIPKKIALIKEYEETEEWKHYTVEVHALKSASKQVGAMDLSVKALELENAGNALNSQLIHAKTDALLKQYAEYYQILKPYFANKKKSSKLSSQNPPITKQALKDAFAHMATAIDDLDMDAMEAVAKELSSYSFPTDQQQLYQRFCAAVEDLDVDSCESIIENWKQVAQL